MASDEIEVIANPSNFLSDGGNVYFLHEGVLYYAPMLMDGVMQMQDAGPVGFHDGISEENTEYCHAVEAALHLLEVRNKSEAQ